MSEELRRDALHVLQPWSICRHWIGRHLLDHEIEARQEGAVMLPVLFQVPWAVEHDFSWTIRFSRWTAVEHGTSVLYYHCRGGGGPQREQGLAHRGAAAEGASRLTSLQ